MDSTIPPSTPPAAALSKGARYVLQAAGVATAAALLLAALKLKLFALLILAGVFLSLSLALFGGVWATAALATVSALAGFLALETGLLLVGGSGAAISYPREYFVPSESIGYVARAGKHKIAKLTGAGKAVYRAEYTVAEDGFRSTPLEYRGSRSAYFLGCSFTFGEGLGDTETLPYAFGKLNPEFSVKNYGMHGYGPAHNLVTLSGQIQERGALIVLQTSPWHAFRTACIPPWLKGSPRFVLAKGGGLQRDGVCDPFLQYAQHIGIIRHSKVYQTVLDFLERREEGREGVLELYLAILGELKRVADARSHRFIVAYIRSAEADARRLGASNERIMASIKAMGIEVVDVTLSPTAESMPPELHVSPLDPHPSGIANRRRAELLSEYLHSTKL